MKSVRDTTDIYIYMYNIQHGLRDTKSSLTGVQEQRSSFIAWNDRKLEDKGLCVSILKADSGVDSQESADASRDIQVDYDYVRVRLSSTIVVCTVKFFL